MGVAATRTGRAPEIDQDALDRRALEIRNRWPSVGLALGVVAHGGLRLFHGGGLADVASHRPITEDTVFRVGSMTKTFVAVAVMQLWEQGRLDLDAPVHDYLRAFRLEPTRSHFRPPTLRHLLTHTAGLPQVLNLAGHFDLLYGDRLPVGRRRPSLAELYHRGLPIESQPGSRLRYTGHGFTTLGQVVEDVTGSPIERYLSEHVFEPLGMASTDLLRSERLRARLATGYQVTASGTREVPDYELQSLAAGAAYSTPRDMACYLAALLGGGANEHGSVLRPETVRMMFEPSYQPDPRIPGVGIEFNRGEIRGHFAVEHGGVLPDFVTWAFLAPDDRVGVIGFTNGSRRALFWMPGEVSALLAHLLGADDAFVRADCPQHPEVWADIAGWYRPTAGLTDMQARGMFGLGVEVLVRRDRLVARALSPVPDLFRGFVLHPDDPDDPYVFRIDAAEYGLRTGMRVVFSQDERGRTRRMHFEAHPLSLEKRPAVENPRYWTTGALAVLAGAAAASVLRRGSTTR